MPRVAAVLLLLGQIPPAKLTITPRLHPPLASRERRPRGDGHGVSELAMGGIVTGPRPRKICRSGPKAAPLRRIRGHRPTCGVAGEGPLGSSGPLPVLGRVAMEGGVLLELRVAASFNEGVRKIFLFG